MAYLHEAQDYTCYIHTFPARNERKSHCFAKLSISAVLHLVSQYATCHPIAHNVASPPIIGTCRPSDPNKVGEYESVNKNTHAKRYMRKDIYIL